MLRGFDTDMTEMEKVYKAQAEVYKLKLADAEQLIENLRCDLNKAMHPNAKTQEAVTL